MSALGGKITYFRRTRNYLNRLLQRHDLHGKEQPDSAVGFMGTPRANWCGKSEPDNERTTERLAVSDPRASAHVRIQESNLHGIVRHPAILSESAGTVNADIPCEGYFAKGGFIQAGEFQPDSRRN